MPTNEKLNIIEPKYINKSHLKDYVISNEG